MVDLNKEQSELPFTGTLTWRLNVPSGFMHSQVYLPLSSAVKPVRWRSTVSFPIITVNLESHSLTKSCPCRYSRQHCSDFTDNQCNYILCFIGAYVSFIWSHNRLSSRSFHKTLCNQWQWNTNSVSEVIAMILIHTHRDVFTLQCNTCQQCRGLKRTTLVNLKRPLLTDVHLGETFLTKEEHLQ